MTAQNSNTPVALIIFRRPDETAKVIEALRLVRPKQLFVIADGPRLEQPDEIDRCKATRAVIDQVDWDCDIHKNYADVNMGLKHRVSTGLDWVFNTVEEAIILEDDCLPDPTFFRFCGELLEKYRNDERIMMIGGTNVLREWKSTTQSYCFSYFNSCWGWASWRRAWQHYDIEMKLWQDPEVRKKIEMLLANDKHYRSCENMFNRVYNDEINSWALRWFFARLANAGVSITPSVNLISNIGFNKEATHHKSNADRLASLPLSSMGFPLKAPAEVIVDRDYENLRFEKTWGRGKTLRDRLRRMKNIIVHRVVSAMTV
jgi:hypothetical protein